MSRLLLAMLMASGLALAAGCGGTPTSGGRGPRSPEAAARRYLAALKANRTGAVANLSTHDWRYGSPGYDPGVKQDLNTYGGNVKSYRLVREMERSDWTAVLKVQINFARPPAPNHRHNLSLMTLRRQQDGSWLVDDNAPLPG